MIYNNIIYVHFMCEGALVCFVLCFSDGRRKWLGGIYNVSSDHNRVTSYIFSMMYSLLYDEMRMTLYNYIIQLEKWMYTGLHCNV